MPGPTLKIANAKTVQGIHARIVSIVDTVPVPCDHRVADEHADSPARRLKRLPTLLLLVAVALLTQVGALALALAWLVGRRLLTERMGRWRRTGFGFLLFVAFFGLLHLFIAPSLAALRGRVPLPCAARPDQPLAAAHPMYCWLDRHYVDPRLLTLLLNLSREVARQYPGTTTLYLDGNLPFVNGFPLLPHLSHADGRKLDIALDHRGPDGGYRPGEVRSPIGYWAFEEPAPGERRRRAEPAHG